MSFGAQVVLSHFRSLADCGLGLALVFAPLGLWMPPVVLPVLSSLFRVVLPPHLGPGLPPGWRCALVCRLLGSACSGAPMPGWAVLAAACPGFIGSLQAHRIAAT